MRAGGIGVFPRDCPTLLLLSPPSLCPRLGRRVVRTQDRFHQRCRTWFRWGEFQLSQSTRRDSGPWRKPSWWSLQCHGESTLRGVCSRIGDWWVWGLVGGTRPRGSWSLSRRSRCVVKVLHRCQSQWMWLTWLKVCYGATEQLRSHLCLRSRHHPWWARVRCVPRHYFWVQWVSFPHWICPCWLHYRRELAGCIRCQSV